MAPSGFRLRLYAHRGASAQAPENTLTAFGTALSDGANALELDIHRTSDGHFVVAHDPDGVRLAGRGERIAELRLDALRSWRIGGEPVPTLVELLRAFPDVPLSIDLKPNDPTAVAPLLELLSAHGGEDRVTVASFHDRLVWQVRRLGWAGRTALTQGEVAALRLAPFTVARRLIRGQAAQIPTRSGIIRLDRRALLVRCRRLGIRADYWVVNDPEEGRTLLAAGATGLMTDEPARLVPVIRGFER
jgi:glycerophosphoryl diester phosphodiesterase